MNRPSFEDFHASVGMPTPLGTSSHLQGVNFSVFVSHAQAVSLLLYPLHEPDHLIGKFPLTPTGEIWHILLQGPLENLGYLFEIHRDYQPLSLAIDPYAKALSTSNDWGKMQKKPLFGVISPKNAFDWQNIASPGLALNDLSIYEMHVRGFTQDPSSCVQHPGTFLGMIEKIPHLLELGVNAVELLPIQEFNENEYAELFPNGLADLYNYWGYSSRSFFALMNRFAVEDAMLEFKQLVRELHRNRIEVILDVVFNHTAEGGQVLPGFSFRVLADKVYYMQTEKGRYRDYTGCGNTLNSNHPVVRELIINCLRYWVTEMHVDGFRFDLASALTRNAQGNPLSLPPLIEAISEDPILSKTKLIAEPWDAGMLYQVGNFYPLKDRWSEWNGRYRDCIRRFIRGDGGQKGEFATRISGSSDMYGRLRSPTSSINFVTIHDGFTLHDLVSYQTKHNLNNGENNRDGTNDNDSWNCGHEGETQDPTILSLRQRQMRNFHLALCISQGIPLFLMGDEYAHTKAGNNNTWCQDNALNWFLWDKLKENEAFYRFYKGLIHFRTHHPLLKRATFLTPGDIDWHGATPFQPLWNQDNHLIAFALKDEHREPRLYIAFNANKYEVEVQLPPLAASHSWGWIVNTSQPPPKDFLEQAEPIQQPTYKMPPFSAIMLQVIS